VWQKLATRTKRGGKLYIVGVDAAKDAVYARLRLQRPGPGYCHLPKDREPSWFSGLISETVVTRYSRGFPVRENKLRPGLRNEPLDCRVYAYAALCSFGRVGWAHLVANRESQRKEQQKAPEVQQPSQKPQQPAPQRLVSAPMRSNWLTNWRR
jgi:phage terminase large subunit GpA-like protein